jgi:LacI family transcriptional regulator
MRVKKTPSKNNSIEDVARVAGVSITTVSRVINKFPSVKEKNRIRVLDAVKQLNYQPSIIAQRLATGKSNVVGLVIPRYEGMFYSFYVLELLRGIGTLCEVLKLDLLLHLADSRSQINVRGAGGYIFADIIANRHQLESVMREGLPVVVINNYVDDIAADCIAVDNLGGAESAVDYLISLGHTKIAHVAGDVITQAAAWRLEGYVRSLRKHGVPVRDEYIVKTDYSRGQARQAAEKLLSLSEPPTAIFAASDSMALEVMAVLREAGKVIPKDFSLIGFDDNPSGLYGPVALTTVRQPLVKMAQESVKRLSVLMKSNKKIAPEKILLPTELVVRESCRTL